MGDTDDRDERVGSVGDEAAKLFHALQGWAREQDAEGGDAAGSGTDPRRPLWDHVATGSPECRYCPVCQVISAVRGTPPEVREHLAAAATSTLRAVSAFLTAQNTDADRASERGTGFEKIDLSDGEDWEEEGWD